MGVGGSSNIHFRFFGDFRKNWENFNVCSILHVFDKFLFFSQFFESLVVHSKKSSHSNQCVSVYSKICLFESCLFEICLFKILFIRNLSIQNFVYSKVVYSKFCVFEICLFEVVREYFAKSLPFKTMCE